MVDSSIPLTHFTADACSPRPHQCAIRRRTQLAVELLDPESKNDFFSDHLRINAAALRNELEKNPNWICSLPTCSFGFKEHGGRCAHSRHREISIDQQLAKGLTVGADATYIDAVTPAPSRT